MKTDLGFAPAARATVKVAKPAVLVAIKTAAKPAVVKTTATTVKAAVVKTATKPAALKANARTRAVQLLADIKTKAPKAWADVIAKVGKPPNETGLGDAWDWISGALNTASTALDKYGEYKKNTATWKAELEALKAQTAQANAVAQGSYEPSGSSASSTNYTPWALGALGLFALYTLRPQPTR